MKRNLGIDLLRVWMSFEVVLCHFGHDVEYSIPALFFSKFRVLAVPVFMLVSFFLTAKLYLNCEPPHKLWVRLKRIYSPLIAWAFIYFFVYNISDALGAHVPKATFADLLWQIIAGHALNPAMWFNVVLALLTVLFFLIYKYFSNYKYTISIVCIALALGAQYLGVNSFLFKDLGAEIAYPLGRVLEMIPYASCGLLLYVLSNKFQSYNDKKFLIIALVLISGIIVYGGWLRLPGMLSFDYGGVDLLFISVTLLIIFYNLPVSKMPIFIRRPIEIASKYSMGIYCMHLLVGNLVSMLNLPVSSFIFSIIIYIISLCVAVLLSNIPIRGVKAIVE